MLRRDQVLDAVALEVRSDSPRTWWGVIAPYDGLLRLETARPVLPASCDRARL